MKKIVLSILVMSILLLSACNSTSLPSNVKNDTPGQEPTDGIQQTPEPTQDLVASLLSIGDSSTLNDWAITVSNFYYTDKIDISAYTFYQPDDGNQYAVAEVQVTNNGKESNTFLPSFSTGNDVRAKIYYAGEYEYSSTVLLGVNEDLHDSTLNPLTSKDGIIVFSIPDTVVNGEDSLVLTLSAGHDEISFSLR